MKKCIITVTLVLAMVFTMTTTVFAADNKDWQSEVDTLGAAVVNNVHYHSLQDAVDVANGNVVKLLEEPTEAITVSGELALDLNGFTATVNGGGTLTLTDSATDNGTVGGKVYGDFTVANRITQKGTIQYVVLDHTDESGKTYYTANAVRVVLKRVSIRTSCAGIYYTTELKFNRNVVNAGATYGVVLSVLDKPGANFLTEDANSDSKLDNLWTAGTPAQDADFSRNGNSCLVKDILSSEEGVTAEANATRGAEDIYANGYVTLTAGGEKVVIMAENNGDIKYSLKAIMETFDTKLAKELTGEAELSATAKGVYAFYSQWADSMVDWELDNFKDYDQRTYDLQEDVLYMGRTYELDGTQWFNWSASGFSVRFQGSGLQAKIASKTNRTPAENNYAYLKVYVDEEEPVDIRLDETMQIVTLAEGLDPDVEHTVEVRKRNSPVSSTAGLVSMEVLGGVKLAKPAEKEMLIEFVGDSLTVGWSAGITDPAGTTAWSTATEDGTKTYSKLVADELGAEYMVTAISGRGVVMNNAGGSDPLLPEVYPELDICNVPGTAYDFALQPDVIVINLGTNDATNENLDVAVFQAGVVDFIELVREKNPNAQIIWAYGLRQDEKTAEVAEAIEEAVGQINDAGDTKVYYLALDLVPDEQMDLNHPLAAGYEASANKLIDKINEITGAAAAA